MSANTKYVVNNVGDLSTLFLPLSSGTSTTATGYLYNAGTIGPPNYQDLNTLFAAYLSAPAAPTTSFKSSLHGGNDLNQVFQNIDNPLNYTINSQSNIIITQYKNINGYNAVTFECSSPTTTVGLASITSFVALNDVTIIIVGGGGGGSYASGQGGGGGGSLTYSLTSTIPTSSTYNIQVGNGGTGGIAGIGTPENGVNGATSFLTVIDSSSTTILNLEATGGQGGLSWVLDTLYPTLGGGGIPTNINLYSTSGSLTQVGGGGGSGGSYLAASGNAQYGGTGGTPTGSGTLLNGINGANRQGDSTAGGSYSGNGGNSGLTSVNLPFLSTSITLGGGGGGSSNKSGSNLVGTWAGAAGAGIGGKGSINKGYTGPTPYPPVSGNGTNSITTGYGGGGGAGLGNADGTNTQCANGGSGGAGCVILYWPVPP